MRLKRAVFVAGIIILLLASTGTMAAGWGGGGARARFGKGVRVEGGGGIYRHHWRRLELTAEQEKQILTLRQEFYKKSLPLRQRLQQLRLELRQLWAEEKPDAAAINKKLTEMSPLRIELRAMTLETWAEMKKALTPEQLERLENLKPAKGKGFPRRKR